MASQSIGPLPVKLEEITAEFLTAALAARFPGVQIGAIRIDHSHHGFSTVLRVHLEPAAASTAANLPKTVMLNGQFEDATRKRGRDYTWMSLEMEFHAYELLPRLELNIPEVYFKALDAERAQMVILMEDLAARGVSFGNGLKPQSAAQVKRRISALAAFHAKTWDSPELKEGGRYHILPSNGATMFYNYLDHAGYDREEWERYCAKPRGMACSNKFHDYDWLRRAIRHAGRLSDQLPNCVVHGDTHLGNLYEEADGRPGFFDSLARREAGIMEITYHICNVMDPWERRRVDRDLVSHYRDELISHGVNAPSLDEMMYQYASFMVINYVTFLVNEPTYQTEAFNTAHASRANIAMLDHDVYDLVMQAPDP
jgi:hypothetical protein